MRYALAILLISCVFISVASATYPNETNATTPIKFSFQGGQNFGENPLAIFDSATGDHVFSGNTGSKNITQRPDRNYTLRVEPAGLNDAFNSPDAGLFAMMDYTDRNPLGVVIFVFLIAIALRAYRRK